MVGVSRITAGRLAGTQQMIEFEKRFVRTCGVTLLGILSDATARRSEDVLGSIGRRTWASALTTVVDNCGDKDKKRAGNEYPRHNVRAGPTADRKDLASDDQCTSNHHHDDSGPAGMSYGSGHDRNCTRTGLQCPE
jgi:hypothetical protein